MILSYDGYYEILYWDPIGPQWNEFPSSQSQFFGLVTGVRKKNPFEVISGAQLTVIFFFEIRIKATITRNYSCFIFIYVLSYTFSIK